MRLPTRSVSTANASTCRLCAAVRQSPSFSEFQSRERTNAEVFMEGTSPPQVLPIIPLKFKLQRL
jgi:hypothetical protein